MRELRVLLLAAPLMACMQIGTSAGAGPGSGGGSTSVDAGAPDAGPTGTRCFEDPATRTVLCEEIAICPGVAVDPGAFPDCGFRLGAGRSLDLECLCGSALCPVGVPTTCAQANQLLDGQSALLVCQQRAYGLCVELVAPDAGGGTCDTVCRAECAGTPSCLQLCGC
jgi:hypothetical protein